MVRLDQDRPGTGRQDRAHVPEREAKLFAQRAPERELQPGGKTLAVGDRALPRDHLRATDRRPRERDLFERTDGRRRELAADKRTPAECPGATDADCVRKLAG